MAWLLTLAMLLTVFSPLSAMAFSNSGEYTLPVDSYITYGIHGYSGHTGADFKASIGTTVVASKAGTVVTALDRGCRGSHRPGNNYGCSLGTNCPAYKAKPGSYGSYANYIVIDHGNGVKTYYCHLKTGSFKVSVGDHVEQGTILAESGVAGNTTGPHLHFEVRDGGTIVDPEDYLTNTYVEGGSNNLPVLCVDIVQGWQNHIYVKGWAFDPDNTSAKVAVHVYINNECHEVIADKYHDQGLDDTFHCGTDHGFDQDILTDQTGEVTVSFYAIDEQDADQHSEPFDNSSYKNPTKVTITSDKTGPTISNAKITNVDSTGYTVTCTVTDASGVNRVQFPTWTKKNDQDDLLSDWGVNPKVSGTRNGNTFTFRVKTSDHNNESGVYYTHIYAYDNSYRGNCSGPVALNVTVPAPTVAVTGVSLNKTSLSFTGTGSSQTLTATVSPSNATNKTLTWSSSNTSVATVSNGVVKAVGFGTATITAKSNNGKTVSCSVTVNPIAVTGVSLNKSSLNFIGTGSSQTLTATVSPSNATNKTLTWSSSNTSVATVSNGVVKAVGFGTATITAKSNNGKTAAVKVTVEQVALSSIAVATMPSKTYYYAGETLNTAGLTLKATYNNGSTKTITEGFTCSPTKLNTVNHSQPITVSYGGKTTTFTVNVNEFYVKSIEIASAPTKTAYFVGDTLDTTGLKIKVFYNSGASKVFDTGFTCTPTTLNTAGTQTITVSYKDATISVPKTATFDVTVQNVTLSGIAVASKPSKVNYFVGDTLNTTGLKLTATYNNGTTQTITGGFTCTPTALSTAGAQTVTVNYGGKTATFTVNVQDVTLSGIAIASNPTKTSYYVGDTLDTTGLKLTATYSNGTTQTITGGFTCTPTALSTAGAQTVTVNYGGKTATFTVSVELPVLPFVTLTFDPTDGVLDLADTPEKTVYPGEAYGRLPEPTADGMVFLGWYTESGKRITSLTTCDLTGDATVSARWALASAEGWSFDEATGTLTLDGSGAMKEYTSAAEAPWYSYRDSIEHLVVKSGVTSLSSYAFVGCQNLADITLPDTLQTIGTMTFYGCDSLNNVTIPASVRTIGSYAFADALSLSRITFAGDAPEFGTGVFTFRKLTAYYPVYASGWETVVDGRYDFGGSITWVRSSESLAAEEPVLLSAAEPDDVLALDWTL